MMADRHLEAAAEAVDRDFELWPSPHYLPNSPKQPLARDMLRQVSETAVTAYLDSLLGELPEEAVEAAGKAWDGCGFIDQALEAFLMSLRDSLVSGRGEATDA